MKTFALIPSNAPTDTIAQKKISNVKIFRHAARCTFREAKVYVDRRCDELRVHYLNKKQIGELIWDYHTFIMANSQCVS